MDPTDISMTVELGKVTSGGGEIGLRLIVQGTGHGCITLSAKENGKKEGQYVFLDLASYNELRRIIRKADETIKELSANKKMTELRLPWH